MDLPESFLTQMRDRLGDELQVFLQSLDFAPPVSIHFNPLKSSKKEITNGVKWYNNGAYLEERPVFTLDPFFHAGFYYVQEASSMFLAEVVKQSVGRSEPLRVLDLAAAPGGKSTLLASILHPESFILCNEVIKSRFKILDYNLAKWGMPNTHVSNHDSKDFKNLNGFFDLILLDAPCSGEGLFRKDPGAVDHWSPDHVKFCSLRQQRILNNTVNLLRPGGTLIYSTCTYNPNENEANVQWLEQNFSLQEMPLKLPANWQIEKRVKGYQFYPHKQKGEGFYIACLKKMDGNEGRIKSGTPARKLALSSKEVSVIAPWISTPEKYFFIKDKNEQVRAILNAHLDYHQIIRKSLPRYLPGTGIGTLKRGTFIPSPELALSIMLSPTVQSIELNLDQSLRFLKKEDPRLDEIPSGWTLSRYQGAPLGWLKGIKNRVNNYYPKEWRIRMNIE